MVDINSSSFSLEKEANFLNNRKFDDIVSGSVLAEDADNVSFSDEISASQVNSGNETVDNFNIDYLYEASFVPRTSQVLDLQSDDSFLLQESSYYSNNTKPSNNLNVNIEHLYTEVSKLNSKKQQILRPRINAMVKKVLSNPNPEITNHSIKFLENNIALSQDLDINADKKYIDKLDQILALDENTIIETLSAENKKLGFKIASRLFGSKNYEDLSADEITKMREQDRIPNFITNGQYSTVHNLVKNLDFDINAFEENKNLINNTYKEFINQADGTKNHSSNFIRTFKQTAASKFSGAEKSLNSFLAKNFNLAFKEEFINNEIQEDIVVHAKHKNLSQSHKISQSVNSILGINEDFQNNEYIVV